VILNFLYFLTELHPQVTAINSKWNVLPAKRWKSV